MTGVNEKSSYYYKLFRVKRSDGRVTTVSMNPILVTQACRVVPGGIDAVGKFVRKAVLSYEEGTAKNCSSYVSDKLLQEIKQITEGKKAGTAASACA